MKLSVIVSLIDADESNIGVLSCGEQIAAAFQYNRMDWLPDAYQHPLDALARLGDNCLHMIIDYHRGR